MTEETRPGRLPKNWRDDFVAAAEKKIPGAGKCAICGSGNATFSEHAVTPIVWEGGIVLGGAVYPQAMVVCNNCGHTSYYNLIVLGVVRPEQASGGNRSDD